MAKVLVVENDLAIATAISLSLRIEHHTVDVLTDGALALEYLRLNQYDLVIMAWQIPFVHGVDICRTFRSRGGTTPILMLTNLSTLEHKVDGFNSGIDDYLTKPFHLQELQLRARALLRRPPLIASEHLTIGNLTINCSSRVVCFNGERLHLTPIEFDVLQYLARHPDIVITPETLCKRIWSTDSSVTLDSVYTTINRLRKRISPGDKQKLIKTVPRVGYKLVPMESAVPTLSLPTTL